MVAVLSRVDNRPTTAPHTQKGLPTVEWWGLHACSVARGRSAPWRKYQVCNRDPIYDPGFSIADARLTCEWSSQRGRPIQPVIQSGDSESRLSNGRSELPAHRGSGRSADPLHSPANVHDVARGGPGSAQRARRGVTSTHHRFFPMGMGDHGARRQQDRHSEPDDTGAEWSSNSTQASQQCAWWPQQAERSWEISARPHEQGCLHSFVERAAARPIPRRVIACSSVAAAATIPAGMTAGRWINHSAAHTAHTQHLHGSCRVRTDPGRVLWLPCTRSDQSAVSW